uniref:Uncharacterized protein n=1 Tax=Arundo donax TaxID=35708 RepID=A0A0A9AMA0_ARUDO
MPPYLFCGVENGGRHLH